jgi:flagellar M-ring protein FliF
MEALNPVLQPVLRVWRGLSRPQQIGLGIILAAGLGLLFIVSTVGRGADTGVAFSGLSDQDAATVVDKLKAAKIPYELTGSGVIKVPTAQVEEAKLLLASSGLGGKPAAGSGFELFDQNSFGQTELTQQINFQRALETELARSIDRLDAVDSSRVHLVIPKPSLFTTQQKDATASVVLRLKTGRRFDSAQARSITQLVANGVEGLKPQNVTIVDINGNTLTGDDASDGSARLNSKQLDTQRNYEATVERDLQAMLDRVLGSGKAAVRVSAVMNWDQVEQTNETYTPTDPTQTPVRTNHTITENSTNGAAGAGGVPGTQANNGAVPTYQGAGTGSGGSTSKSESDTTYELNKQVQKVVRAPGAVQRVSVSVMLDDDPTNPTPGLQQSVQNAVNAAAGIDATRGDVLTVTALPFNRQELQTTQQAMQDAAQQAQVLSYGRLGALALGPILMLVVLFFILTRGRKKEKVIEVTVAGEMTADAIGAVQPLEQTPTTPVVPGKPGKPNMPTAQPIVEDPQKVYIREQIQNLGKSNPATVAQLIQTWMDEDRRN